MARRRRRENVTKVGHMRQVTENSTIYARASTRAPFCSLPNSLYRSTRRYEETIDEGSAEGLLTGLPLWSCQLIFFRLTHLFGNIKGDDDESQSSGLASKDVLGVCGVEVFDRKNLRLGHDLYRANLNLKGTKEIAITIEELQRHRHAFACPGSLL